MTSYPSSNLPDGTDTRPRQAANIAPPTDQPFYSSSSTSTTTSTSITGHHIRARTSKLFASGKDFLAAQDWKGKASSARDRLNEVWNGSPSSSTVGAAAAAAPTAIDATGGKGRPSSREGAGGHASRRSFSWRPSSADGRSTESLSSPKNAFSTSLSSSTSSSGLSPGPSPLESRSAPLSPLVLPQTSVGGADDGTIKASAVSASSPTSPLLSPFFGPIDAASRKISRGIDKLKQKSAMLYGVPSAATGGATSGNGGGLSTTPPAGPLVAASPLTFIDGQQQEGHHLQSTTVGLEARDLDVPEAAFSAAAENDAQQAPVTPTAAGVGADSPTRSPTIKATKRSRTLPVPPRLLTNFSTNSSIGTSAAAAAFSTTSLPSTIPSTTSGNAQEQYIPVAPGLPNHAPGTTVPVLLPGYATRKVARDRYPQSWASVDKPEDLEDGEVEIDVYLHGMVLKTAENVGTRQRVFNQMAKQLAGLPRAARKTSYSTESAPQSPITTAPSSQSNSVVTTPSAIEEEGPATAQLGYFGSNKFTDEPLTEEPHSEAASQASSSDSPKQGKHAHRHQQQHHLGDKIAQKLVQGVDEDALLKLIERAGILPNEQPIEEVMSEEEQAYRNRGKASGVRIGKPNDTFFSPSYTGYSSSSEPPSPLASPGLDPALGTASQSKREKAMSALSALRTTPLRNDSNSTITVNSLSSGSSAVSPGGTIASSSDDRPPPPRRTSTSSGSSAWSGRSLSELQVLQRNLDSRLRAFWTYRVEHREVRIEMEPVFSKKVHDKWRAENAEKGTPIPQPRLLATTAVWTNSSGRFEHRLTIPWYMLDSFCKHHEATRDIHPKEIIAVRVRAVLMNHKNPFQKAYEWATNAHGDVTSPSQQPHSASTSAGTPMQTDYKHHVDAASTSWVSHHLSEDGHTQVRVISDIDDTVKHTEVTGGLRAVFHNVFVKSFEEVTIEGIGKWYQSMRAAGVPIHYVSNAPLELYGLVQGFMRVAGLPEGHLHMKLYPTGARNLLASYLEPAGERKRGAVQAILDDFKDSKFILIGDSGELDLELYSQIAAERPQQIKAIFIRDVSTPRSRDAPKRKFSFATSSARSSATNSPLSTSPGFFDPSFQTTSTRPTAGTAGATSSSLPAPPPPAGASAPFLTEAEYRRREAFRARVRKARELVPKHIRLTFYRTGEEVEAEALGLISHHAP